MSKFKIGDRVVIVNSPGGNGIGIGHVSYIVEQTVFSIYDALHPAWAGFIKEGDLCNTLDEPPLPMFNRVGYPDYCLELYKDDGNEKGEWTDDLKRLCNKVSIDS